MSSYICSVKWEYCKGKRKKWYFYGEKANNGSINMVKQKREETRSGYVYGPRKPSGMLILFPFPA